MSSLEERIARLEALVERQQATIEQQQRTIAEKDAVIERLQARVAELERKPEWEREAACGTIEQQPAIRAQRAQAGRTAGPQGAPP